MKCYYCEKDKDESKFTQYSKWLESGVLSCCSGRDCGCMGRPIEPPVCNMCILKCKIFLFMKKVFGG